MTFDCEHDFCLHQESLDHLNRSKNHETQIEKLKSEIQRISQIENVYENVKVSSSTRGSVISAPKCIICDFHMRKKWKIVLVPLPLITPYHFLAFVLFVLNLIFIHVCVCL